MSNRATAEQYAPRLGLVGSIALHACIVAATLFTWAHRLDITEQPSQVVPVELVSVADRVNVAPMTKEPLAPPLDPAMIQPQMQPVLEAPKIEIAPAPKPLPTQSPLPQPKKDEFDINNIMALLDKQHAAVATVKNAKPGTQNVTGIGAQSAMTADLRSLLQSEIYKCWSPPVGAPHAEDMIVAFDLYLNPDGSVAQPPQLTANSTAAAAGSPYARAAAEAARRAIFTCAPYKLPAERYSQWRAVTFTFDPRDMMGQ